MLAPIRSFYEYHREMRGRPLINPFPQAKGIDDGSLNAHQMPVEVAMLNGTESIAILRDRAVPLTVGDADRVAAALDWGDLPLAFDYFFISIADVPYLSPGSPSHSGSGGVMHDDQPE